MCNERPSTAQELDPTAWDQIEPTLRHLAQRPLTARNLADWLADWSYALSLLEETSARLEVAAAQDTTNAEAESRLETFQEQIYAPAQAANQAVKEHLLESNLTPPPGFEVPLAHMRAEANLFREENLPLVTEEQRLVAEVNRITGAQTVEWDGQEVTLYQLEVELQNPDRQVRERAWRLSAERRLADRQAIADLWAELVNLRHQMARNAGCQDYRAFRWQQLHRLSYTPEDVNRFHQTIESVAVPAAARIHERSRRQLRVDRLRPWDLEVDPLGRPPLHPFDDVEELEAKAEAIFQRIDPELGAHFATMRHQELLDLENRKNKAPHGWCATYPLARQPFIFLNAVGWQRDVTMLLHEAGHAFHVFEMTALPYIHQLDVPAEFLEVAAMAMELLAGPYMARGEGGFYSEEEAARARIKHLEDAIVVSWPYIAAMDVFQHWVYAHPDAVADSDNRWAEIWCRFMPAVDWSGLEEPLAAGWQPIPHFFGWPLSGIEYGIAQLGAVQVWRNSMEDRPAALARYRQALSLGCTVSLHELYRTAGAALAFDTQTLERAVDLMESTIARLGKQFEV